MIKKGDLVTAAGPLKEVVDFLASSSDERLRLIKTFMDGGSPSEDAKSLVSPRKVTKIYKDTLEVSTSKDWVWEDRKEYFVGATIEPKAKTGRRNSVVAKDISSAEPLPSSDSRSSQFVVEQNS